MKYQRPLHSTLAAILCAFFALAFHGQAQEVPSEYQEVTHSRPLTPAVRHPSILQAFYN